MPKQFLKNCVIAIAGNLNDPGDHRWDEEKVRGWVSTYGGTFTTTVGPNVTHLLCTESDAKKKTTRVKAALKQKDTFLVTRYWLDECIVRKSLVKAKNSEYDLKAGLAAQQAKKRKSEKDAKSSALTDSYVDERYWNIYRDVTFFEHQVTLTLNDPEAGPDGQRYVVTLWESKAKPYSYLLTSLLYNKAHAKPNKWRATEAPTSFEKSFLGFKKFFKSKTGIEWDERLAKTEGSGKFKYSPPTKGKPVGLVYGRIATNINDSPSVSTYFDGALSNTGETEQLLEEDCDSSERPAKRARLDPGEPGRYSRIGTLSATTSLADRPDSRNPQNEFTKTRTPMRREATAEGHPNDTAMVDSFPSVIRDDVRNLGIDQKESRFQMADVDFNQSSGLTPAAPQQEQNAPFSTLNMGNGTAGLFGIMEGDRVLDSCEPQFHDANIDSNHSYPPPPPQPPNAPSSPFDFDKLDEDMDDLLAYMQKIPVGAPPEEQVQDTWAAKAPAYESTEVASQDAASPTFDYDQDLINLFSSMQDGVAANTFEPPMQDTNGPSSQSHQKLAPSQQEGSGVAMPAWDESDMEEIWASIMQKPVGEFDALDGQGANGSSDQPNAIPGTVTEPQRLQDDTLSTLNFNDLDNGYSSFEQPSFVQLERQQVQYATTNVEYPYEQTEGHALLGQPMTDNDVDEADGDMKSLFGASQGENDSEDAIERHEQDIKDTNVDAHDTDGRIFVDSPQEKPAAEADVLANDKELEALFSAAEAGDGEEQYHQPDIGEAGFNSYHPDDYAPAPMQQDQPPIEQEPFAVDRELEGIFGAMDDEQIGQPDELMSQHMNFDFTYGGESALSDNRQVEPQPEPEVLGIREWEEKFLSMTNGHSAPQGNAVTHEGEFQREQEAPLADTALVDGDQLATNNDIGNSFDAIFENDDIFPDDSKSNGWKDDLDQAFEDVEPIATQPDVSQYYIQQPHTQSPDMQESDTQLTEIQELDPQLPEVYPLELQREQMKEDGGYAQLAADFEHTSIQPHDPIYRATSSPSYASSSSSDISPADPGPEVRAAGLVALRIYREHHRGVLKSNDNEGALIAAVCAEMAEEEARRDAEKEAESEEDFTWADCLAEDLGEGDD